MEGSIRIFQQGVNVSQSVRIVELMGNKLNDEQLERVCSNLRNTYGLGAIPYQRVGEHQSILVISNNNLNGYRIKEGNWFVTLTDNNNLKTLRYSNPVEREPLADILVRAMYGKLEKSQNYNRIDTPKIWYDSNKRIAEEGDIIVYQRYNVSGFPIENEGIGIGLHVETAFFTNKTVQHYFVTGQKERFDRLTSRQEGARGTLLYKVGKKRLKCYFVEYCDGMTVSTTGKLTFEGQTFDSLYTYYTQKYPGLKFNPDDKVVKVSFDINLASAVPVSANMLFVRIMNDVLPASLRKLDKIPPYKRKPAEHEFWSNIGEYPLSNSSLKLKNTDWQPGGKNTYQLPLPNITFNQDKILNSPASRNKHSYGQYYHTIKKMLDDLGCYHVPANIPRTIIFPFSANVPQQLQKKFSSDIVARISKLTNKEIKAEILNFKYSYSEVFMQLKNVPSGMIVFTMTNDPAIYYDIESELKRFDIKRLTEDTLFEQADFIQKKHARWSSFIDLCCYDILVQMRCIPYLPELSNYYDAMLVIDVGEKSKFFGVSLLINKIEARKIIPLVVSNTHYKADAKSAEMINERQLETRIMETFNTAKRKARFPLIKKMLVVRDGRLCGNEQRAVETAHKLLISANILSEDSKVDIVDLHKSSSKEIRFTHTSDRLVDNVLEGTAVIIDKRNLVLATTGGGTLKMGTANPLMIEPRRDDINTLEMLKYLFNGCLFNFFSPSVAQRLPFPVKELDDKLKIKLLQHIPVRG